VGTVVVKGVVEGGSVVSVGEVAVGVVEEVVVAVAMVAGGVGAGVVAGVAMGGGGEVGVAGPGWPCLGLVLGRSYALPRPVLPRSNLHRGQVKGPGPVWLMSCLWLLGYCLPMRAGSLRR